MTLNKILGNLTVKENGTRKANKEYSLEFLIAANDNLKKLEETDTKTTKGLEIYKTITGDNPILYSSDKLEFRKNVYLEEGQKDLGTYVNQHFNSLTDELEESVKINLAYIYCPTKNIAGNDTIEYNSVRKVVSDAKEKIQKIKDDPEAYLIEETKNETPLMAEYLLKYADKFIIFEQNEAQQNALLAIQKYNTTKFLKDTKKHSDTQTAKLIEKQSLLKTNIKTKTEMAEQNKGKILTSIEKATLLSDSYAELKKLAEEYANVEIGNKLAQNIASYAIATIKGKNQTNPIKNKR